ncbi:archease [Maribacter halichondriae]|uniref:archease n=1 Tax=Maribacter halichondriae TaxID=2980554 RepID=UPI002359188D|nr:archease [Maribacter sp. Hal144]
MNHHTLPDKPRTKRRRPFPKIHEKGIKYLEVEGNSLQNLFKNSLKAMAHRLKRGSHDSVSHYDCVMRVEAIADDPKELLFAFLTKVLALTHTHRTIFVSMHVLEFSEKKIVAQVYGIWYDNLDEKIKSIPEHGIHIHKNEDQSWLSSIKFELESRQN